MRLRECLHYWRHVEWLCVAGVLAASLVACSNPRLDKSIPEPDAVDPARNADFTARYPLATNSQAGGAVASSRYLIVPGMDGQMPMAGASAAGGPLADGSMQAGAGTAAGGIEINLDGADIQTAAKTLLGDTLHLNFVVDPRVQGTVTVASVGPVDRRQVFPIFESVLRMSNAALVREGDVVKIVPAPEAAGSGVVSVGVGPPGFGVSVVPLHYASATAVAKLAENFLTRPGALRADPGDNLVFIQGTTSERQAAVDVIAGLDAEWLRNQSVGLYPLKATQPETMIQELDRVFETKDGGAEQGAVQFQPISRLNAVMAVTKSPKLLQRVTQWVERLDRSDTGGTALRVYRLQNADARQVAKTMNDLFVNRSGAGESPSSQLAPGTAASQSRLDSLNSGGSLNGTGAGASSSSAGGSQTGTGTSNTYNGIQATASKSPFEGFAGANQDNGQQDSASLSAGSMPRGLFQNVRITADPGNNSILVYSNMEDYHVIEHALQQLDQPKLQVAIEATVAEVTLTDQLQYGVQNYLTSQNIGMGADKGSIGLFPGATSPIATTSTAATTATGGAVSSAITNQLISRVLPGFNLLLGSETQPSFVLSALSTLTEVKVLSSPSVVALDNQPAMILVGQDVPITTSSATVLTSSNTVVNTIDMRSTGIILKILPHVHANGTVQLEIEQEISNVVNPNSTAAQNLTPTISERRIHSTIVMANGQSAMIGGLISDQQDNSKAGLPGLNYIQYLGDILSTTSKDRQRQEIIMFITPKVIGNGVDMQAISNEFRARLHSLHSESTGDIDPSGPKRAVPGR